MRSAPHRTFSCAMRWIRSIVSRPNLGWFVLNRSPFPKHAKALAVPADERVRLDDQKCLFPMSYAASQDEEPEAVAVCEAGALNLTLKN